MVVRLTPHDGAIVFWSAWEASSGVLGLGVLGISCSDSTWLVSLGFDPDPTAQFGWRGQNRHLSQIKMAKISGFGFAG